MPRRSNLVARIIKLEPHSTPRDSQSGSLLDRLTREDNAFNRRIRLTCLWDILLQARMTDDPRLDIAVIAEAHACYKDYEYYDRPLTNYYREILLQFLAKQDVTLEQVWAEFTSLPLPTITKPSPIEPAIVGQRLAGPAVVSSEEE